MDLTIPLLQLKNKRKIFHSEADFQFALAWEIQICYPVAKVRLEYRPPEIEPNMYIDILVIIDGIWYPIELKYKTVKCTKASGGEIFKLKNHGAQDLGRYDYLLDIMRIEQFSKYIDPFGKGYALMLTNDPLYWGQSSKIDTIDREFRLIDGFEKAGNLKWAEHAGLGTTRGREEPIILSNNYLMQWEEYSKLDNERSGTFKYLLTNIDKVSN